MSVFTAPTYSIPMGEERAGHDSKYNLWRYYDGDIQATQTVIIASGVVDPIAGVTKTFTPDEIAAADAGSGENGKAVWRGAKEHTVTGGEGSLLSAAGYTVV